MDQNISVLHLANDYAGSLVYRNLCQALDSLGIEQAIYVAVRSEELINKNKIDFGDDHSKVFYRNILNNYTRINYSAKIRKVTKDIVQQLKINQYDIVHAHTWFSDGGVALELNKKYGLPYIVTVRGTDVNLFYKYMLHLRSYGIKILQNAKEIIFISQIYHERLYSSPAFLNHLNNLGSKSVVIPNGIDNFWVNNLEEKKLRIEGKLCLIYIGRFIKGKNLERLIKAVKKLNKKSIKCHLNLIGGGGKEHERVLKLLNDKEAFTFHGKVTDKEELKKLINQSHIFTMPSRNETFGLVYIEALSQGIPVVYTVNEGIYGCYDSRIGEAVHWDEIDDIANGIEKIYKNYQFYDFIPREIVQNHKWEEIAKKYISIYKS